MRKLIKMAAIAMALMVSVTACSDDDDDNTLSKTVVGQYGVDFEVYTATPAGPFKIADIENQTLTLTANGNDNSANLSATVNITSLPTPLTIPIAVQNVTLSGTTAKTTVAFNGTIALPEALVTGVPSTATANVPCVISGDIENGKDMDLSITVKGTIAGDLTIEAEGTKI